KIYKPEVCSLGLRSNRGCNEFEERWGLKSKNERGKIMFMCKEHAGNSGEKCLSCNMAISLTMSRKRCECGKEAVGYSWDGKELKFHCDEHYPSTATRKATEQKRKG